VSGVVISTNCSHIIGFANKELEGTLKPGESRVISFPVRGSVADIDGISLLLRFVSNSMVNYQKVILPMKVYPSFRMTVIAELGVTNSILNIQLAKIWKRESNPADPVIAFKFLKVMLISNLWKISDKGTKPLVHQKESDGVTLFITKKCEDKVVEIESSEKNFNMFSLFAENTLTIVPEIGDGIPLDIIKTYLAEDSRAADKQWKHYTKTTNNEEHYFVGIAVLWEMKTASGGQIIGLHSDPRVLLKRSMIPRIYKGPSLITFPLSFTLVAKSENVHNFKAMP
jgi:hypothetical protein